MKIVILLGAVLLAGCASAPSATQTVYVPVHTPCVTVMPVAPVYEFDKLPVDAKDGEKVLALARDWLHGRKYELMLRAAVARCL